MSGFLLKRLAAALVAVAAAASPAPAQIDAPPAARVGTGAEGEFHPINPERLYDSRQDPAGPLNTRQARNVTVTGRFGVPASASSVALTVTADRASANSYLSVFPRDDSSGDPETSNVNFRANQSTPNLVIVRPGVGGQVTVFNGVGTTHFLIDVVGWFTSSGGTPGTLFHTSDPRRCFDTRQPGMRDDGSTRPVGPNDQVIYSDTGGQATATARRTAAVLNVTAADPNGQSYLQVFPFDSTRSIAANLPSSSNLNYRPGQGATANAVITKLNPADGNVGFYNFAGNVEVICDSFGYFDDGSAAATGGLRYSGLSKPVRVVDTRNGTMPSGSATSARFTLAIGETRIIKLAGNAGVPAAGAEAVAINVTVDRPGAAGFLSTYPADQSDTAGRNTSMLNFVPGSTVANFAIVKLAAGGPQQGQIKIYNGSTATLELLVDLFGYMRS